jgi:hypothetical protein
MLRRTRRHVTFANVASGLALVIALSTGTAYAANTVFSTDIVDGEVKTVDIHGDAVSNAKLHDNAVKTPQIDADAVDGSKVLDGSLSGLDIADASITGTDISSASITGNDILTGSIFGSDIADHTLTTSDLNGTDHHGAISVSAIANGRCTTITGSVGGADPGDAVVLTTDGSIPSGMLIYGQRALTDQVQIKVCNLSGATSAAINNLPVRLVTIH